jgi:Xaa-Pro aminopeptidase
MNIPDLKDYEEKKKRLRAFMGKEGYDYVILSRRENFAWFTCGGDNKVLRNSNDGVGFLVVSKDTASCLAYYMDSDRIFDDELRGLDIERKCVYWYQGSCGENAMKLTKGRTAADTDIPGADNRWYDIVRLHYPLTENEAARYRKLGALCDELLTDVAGKIHPGMSEHDIEAEILYAYGKQNMTPKVLLVGTDERIEKYRHPCASPKKLEKLVLIHPAAEKGNLHANITRMIYFGGKVPEELEKKYDLLNLLQAQFFSMAKTGARYRDIYECRKKILAENGYPDEWQYHAMGCVTGYVLGIDHPLINNEEVKPNTPLDMFITLRGAKVEELAVTGDDGAEVLSAPGGWPRKTYEYGGKSYRLPVIMLKEKGL